MATMSKVWLVAAWIGAFAGIACGDALVDESFRGKPIASFEGNVINEGGTVKHPRLAFFWAPSLDKSLPDDLEEQVSTSQTFAIGDTVTVNMFEEPTTTFAWDATDPKGAQVSIGRVLIYDDENQNGRHDAKESWAGGLNPYAVVYAPSTLVAGKGLSRLEVPKGLHVSWLPLPCKADPPVRGTGECGVPLGAACLREDDGFCGTGVCSDRFMFPWPEGACLLAGSMGSCVPKDGALLVGQGQAFFARACKTDDDCDRGYPYRCDPLQGACVPFNPPLVSLKDSMGFMPFCSGMPADTSATEMSAM